MMELTVEAKLDNLNQVLQFVDSRLEEADCPIGMQMKIDVAVEEIFVNIASYALLLMMMAQVTGYQAGDFIHTTGDTHLYLNHLDQARLQLTREPRPLPHMRLNPDVKSLFDFQYEDFQLEDYDPWPHIKADVSV